MLAPKPMSRLLIAASKDQMLPVIQALYKRNLFHIEDFVEKGQEEYAGFRIGHPLEGASEASGELLKIRSTANAIMAKAEDLSPSKKESSSGLRDTIARELPRITGEIEALAARRSELETKKKELETRIEALMPFDDVPADLDLLRGYDSLAVLSGWAGKEVDPGVPAEQYTSPGKDKRFVVIAVRKEDLPAVERVLADAAFQAVPVPAEHGHAHGLISGYTSHIGEVETELAGIAAKLAESREKHGEFLVACDELLTSDVEQAEAPLRFATTDTAFVAEGWVPTAEIAAVTDAVNAAAGGKVLITEVEVDREKDAIPVEYSNPSFAKPTELIMDVYARPRYTEIDPTLVVSIVFPIFFGLILGDVGYGLILLAMALILRKFLKGDDGARLLATLRNFAISSIFFGILFSEFFGYMLPWPSLLFSRHLNVGGHAVHGPMIPELLVLSLWIGILHITLGRVFGIVNHAKQDHGSHRTKAMLANAGWIMLMWGILMLIWSMFGLPLMPDFSTLPTVAGPLNIAGIIGVVLLLAGLVFIARENVLEVVEIPTIISHTLSYARIVAVGLSSVAIALVVNFIAVGMVIEPQLENLTPVGIVLIIVGIVIFIAGHLGNAALGLIGGGLQSLRLQYVEFFTKFYKGGGKKYQPFGKIKTFTED